MIGLVLKSMSNQKRIILLFIVGLVLIQITLPLALVSLDEAMTRIEDDITQHARGSYDILIRPEGSRTEIEKELGLVEENYLTVGKGGISLEEWQRIQNMNEVEVAAPVASLGYYTGISKTFATWMPTQSTRVKVEYYTSDGITRYPINREGESVGVFLEQESIPQRVPEFDVLSKNSATFYHWSPPMFMLPNTYHLMVGIDPESEEKLTGISFESLSDTAQGQFDKVKFDFAGDASIINVMKLVDPKVPIEAEITWEHLDINKNQTSLWKEELGIEQDEPLFLADSEGFNNLFDNLLNYPSVDETQYIIDFKDILVPFEYEDFMVSDNLDILENKYGHEGSFSSTTKFYFAEPVEYKLNDGDYIYVEQKNTYNDIPVYRKVTEQGGTLSEIRGTDIPFILNPRGEFTIEEFQNTLSASPLGIYQLAPVMLVENVNGELLSDPIEMLPTIYPGSFVPTPAHGVINMEDAEIIKGERPIDAIRVRVADIEGYNQESQEIIARLADEFLQNGYEVDIVAGASYQDLDVRIEGIGVVSQSWTTLGAAASIVKGWSGTTLLLSFIFIFTSVVYVLNRLYYYWKGKTQEISVLLQLGWGMSYIKGLYRREFVILVIISWIFSIAGLLMFFWYMGNIDLAELIKWHSMLTGGTLISMLISIEWKLGKTMWSDTEDKQTVIKNNGKKPNEIDIKHLRTYKGVQENFPKLMSNKLITNRLFSNFNIAWKSIHYFFPLILSTFIQITLVGALSIFVYLSIQATAEQTNFTVLGEYVNFRVNSIHFLILISAYALASLTIIESLSSLFSIRRSEVLTLRSIGWKHHHIIKHWLKEVSIWSAWSTILGHIIGFSLFISYFPFTSDTLFVLIISMLGFYFFILTLSYLIIKHFLKPLNEAKKQFLFMKKE